MQQPRPPAESAPAPADAWYRQSIVWLGAAILAASLAGCIWMIVLGARYDDAPLENTPVHALLNMPVQQAGNGERGAKNVPPARSETARQVDAPPERTP
jgi:hypothetical protein